MTENSLKKELDAMDTRLSSVEDKMDSIDKKLSQVVDALIGNPITKTGGFILEIEKLKQSVLEIQKQVARQEDFRKKFVWTVGVIMVGAGIIQFLLNLYLSLKK